MTYKYGDKIMVGENTESAPTGAASVLGVAKVFYGFDIWYWSDDRDKKESMPGEGEIDLCYSSLYWIGNTKYITPLDNGE